MGYSDAAPCSKCGKLLDPLEGHKCPGKIAEQPPERNGFDSLDTALNMYREGEISIGKMRECAAAWKNERPYALPALSKSKVDTR